MSTSDRIRLGEAFRLASQLGDKVWPGWSLAPFPVILVTPDREYLLNYPKPPAEWTDAGYDSFLATHVFTRPRVFQTGFLATFPVFGTTPTIVIGEAENTNQKSTSWVLILLHEHFHQLQYSRPDYYSRVAALDLANGDQTGMWMLNFPFPYDSAAVQQKFEDFTHALASAVAPHSPEKNDSLLALVTGARASFAASVTERQYRYISFELWQEGVARYTELALARLAAKEFKPTSEFAALPDFTTFAAEASSREQAIQRSLESPRLGTRQREVVYPVGAGYALFLDWARPAWKQSYFANLSLDPLLQP
jgi:hypothetical protein